MEFKYHTNNKRFEDAIRRTAELEKEMKEQEEMLMKRHKELNSLMKENRRYKDEIDDIRQ